MRDLISHIGLVDVITPAVLAADSTPAVLDLAGFDSAAFILHVGVGGITFSGTNKIEFVVTHSDDGTTFVPVANDDIQGATVATGGIVLALTAAKAAVSVNKFGYIGNRRYVKLLADFSGTHGTGTPISAILIKSNARHEPVA